jgi:uncharacterized membrane protein YesL
MRVFRIIARGAVAFYDELFLYMLVGLINLIAWILIIPGPFVLAGIYTITQQSVRSKGVNWRMIWDGVKEFGPRSLLLFLIIVGVYAIIGVNLWFYANPEISPFPATVAIWTTPIFALFALIWTGVTFYAQALLMELEDPKMGLVLRNSLFLTILQPVQTLLLLILAIASLALSIALPVLLIVWPGFISAVAVTAARQLIGDLAERNKAQEGEETEDEEEDDDGYAR